MLVDQEAGCSRDHSALTKSKGYWAEVAYPLGNHGSAASDQARTALPQCKPY